MAPEALSAVPKVLPKDETEKTDYCRDIVWHNVAAQIFLHGTGIYGLYLGATSACYSTIIFAILYAYLGNFGIAGGCHRLWSHRSYKARLPLRMLLCAFASIGAQNDIYEWCRDHRVHHKFTETNADPHSIKRGFFFAHVGWLMCKKHPDVSAKGKTVNLDDLWADPVVRFHRRFYMPMVLVFCFYIPTMIPHWMWNESLWNSFFVAGMARYCGSLNLTWLINSAAHKYGNQPFDRYIEARENVFLSFIGGGEGWHNYHHTFPWDYSTSELGNKYNFTKQFIDLMAWVGLAYDRRTVSPEVIKLRMEKTGDHSRKPKSDSAGLSKPSKGL